MLVPSLFTTGSFSFRTHYDTDTGFIQNLEWKNTSTTSSYMLQVYDETTEGRYNFKLDPNTDFQEVDGFISALSSDIFIRITGTVPYSA